MSKGQKPFWRTKTLSEMTRSEWESLCDGCARCCLEKLTDEDTGETVYTSVTCRLLDTWTCRCTRYADRARLAPGCIVMTPDMLDRIPWLPKTCAYRISHEGGELASWHPLLSGNADSVHEAGLSVRDKVVSGRHVPPGQLAAS